MKETLHYLLMADHFLFQKTLFGKIKETGLSIGQPKVLDYLKEHDGTTQREIAAACQIEQQIGSCCICTSIALCHV